MTLQHVVYRMTGSFKPGMKEWGPEWVMDDDVARVNDGSRSFNCHTYV